MRRAPWIGLFAFLLTSAGAHAQTVCDSIADCIVGPCDVIRCDPVLGCVPDGPGVKDDGTPCDDGNACTNGEQCQSGICGGGTQVVCTASDQCHLAGVCNPTTGTCSNPARNDGTPCSDGSACTTGDQCEAGACVAGTPTVCTASDQCHVAGTCDPGTGACSNPSAPDHTTCSDGDACTAGDECIAGTCKGSPVVCAASDQCHDAGTCNPATGLCSDPASANGKSCNDGNNCTTGDKCQAGTCAGTAVTCAASDQCHVAGTCNPTDGKCSNPAANDGTGCDDGNRCTTSDSCHGGTCAGTPVVCTAKDQCHLVGTCDPGTGACSTPNAPNGTGCNDGNGCTTGDKCQAGTCAGTPVVCAASDQCHVAGTCNAATGTCSNPAATDGTGCDDGNKCTKNDACTGGVCGGTALVCSASDQCHDAGTCDPGTGSCTNPAKTDGTACSDGSACTSGDACHAGTCVPGTAKVCAASDQCHVAGTCNPSTGACSNPAQSEGFPCDDHDVCTIADGCHAGVCGGAVLPGCCRSDDACDDGIACTDDRCTAGACVHVPLDERCGSRGDCAVPVCAPGDASADGNGCTARPVDDAVFCTEDADPCTVDVCRLGDCAHEPVTGADCPALTAPFRAAIDLASRDVDVRASVAAAADGTCTKVTPSPGCLIVTGATSPAPRLLALLDAAHTDFMAAVMALGGRLPGASAPEIDVRVRLALGLLQNTPGDLRAFIATAAQGRGRHTIAASFARARQAEARTLLKRTLQLRNQLRRLITKHQSFAR